MASRFYPLIIQTWFPGKGSCLLCGSFVESNILKWAQKEVLRWNELKIPQENEVLIYESYHAPYYLWGMVRCGGVEDFGRIFIEIRAILLDQQAQRMSSSEMQSRLLAIHVPQNPDDMDCQVEWPIVAQVSRPPKWHEYPAIFQARARKQWDQAKKQAQNFLHQLGPQSKVYLAKSICYSKEVWQHRREILANGQKQAQELWQDKHEICSKLGEQIQNFVRNPQELWKSKQGRKILLAFAIAFMLIFLVRWCNSPSVAEGLEPQPPPESPHTPQSEVISYTKQLTADIDSYSIAEFRQKCAIAQTQVKSSALVQCQVQLMIPDQARKVLEPLQFPIGFSIVESTSLKMEFRQDQYKFWLNIESSFIDLVKLPTMTGKVQNPECTIYLDWQSDFAKLSVQEQMYELPIAVVIMNFPKE